MAHRMSVVLAFLVVGQTIGCQPASSDRFPVSGLVTLKGSPLPNGTIEFDATDGSHRSGSVVTNGKYSISAAQGLKPASYTVRVSAVESKQAATDAPPGPESMGAEQANQEQIPSEFNRESKLTYEAGSGKPVTFDVTIP